MKTKNIIVLFLLVKLVTVNNLNAQNPVGTYMKIESSLRTNTIDGEKRMEIDTTLLSLNEDFSFSYKWSPQYGPNANEHIVTTGIWKLDRKKVLLTSKYQFNQSRFFESYEPSYGDSLVKIYIQTYDSLIGFIQFNYVAVVSDSLRKNQLVTKDEKFSSPACSANFELKKVDKIFFCGDFGQMAAVIPKNQRSNHFVLQYNWSASSDYRYFNNEAFYFDGDEIFTEKKSLRPGGKDEASALKKINNLK
ncbi:MAG: hypothetical protein IAF38_10640 [Bacteroidia bacterium]|nr:hypothetical protein [Bacteroidia bacterium]